MIGVPVVPSGSPVGPSDFTLGFWTAAWWDTYFRRLSLWWFLWFVILYNSNLLLWFAWGHRRYMSLNLLSFCCDTVTFFLSFFFVFCKDEAKLLFQHIYISIYIYSFKNVKCTTAFQIEKFNNEYSNTILIHQISITRYIIKSICIVFMNKISLLIA